MRTIFSILFILFFQSISHAGPCENGQTIAESAALHAAFRLGQCTVISSEEVSDPQSLEAWKVVIQCDGIEGNRTFLVRNKLVEDAICFSKEPQLIENDE